MNYLLLSLLFAHGKASAKFMVTCTVVQSAHFQNGALVRTLPPTPQAPMREIKYEPEPRIAADGTVVF